MEQITAEFEKLQSFEALPERRIAVLGGGISGLVAAHALALLGQTVTVFEASSRVGGRILTHRYGGEHAELGAMRIPAAHDYTVFYCRLLGLELEEFINSDANAFYRVRGRTLRMADSAKLAELFRLTPADAALVEFSPAAVLLKFIGKMSEGLNNRDIEHVVSGNIVRASKRVRALDDVTIRDFLLTHAADLDSNREAVEMIGDLVYLKDVWFSSCIALLREVFNDRDHPSQPVAGMDQLPGRIERLLRNDHADAVELRLNTPVTGIRIDPSKVDSVTVISGDEANGTVEESFPFALCTLPFPVMRHMTLDGFSNGKLEAIDQYQYAASTKVVLNFRERFWEALEQPILGGASITDEIACQIFYPSHPDGRNRIKAHSLPIQFPSIDPEAVRATSPVRAPGPGVVIGSYAWGTNARRLGALSREARVDLVRRCMRTVHGRQVDEFFDGGDSMAWEQYRWSAGAFSQPLVRGLQLFRDDAMQPEHRLHFSGEHLSPDPGWIQGSIRSTWRSLFELLAQMAAD